MQVNRVVHQKLLQFVKLFFEYVACSLYESADDKKIQQQYFHLSNSFNCVNNVIRTSIKCQDAYCFSVLIVLDTGALVWKK